MAQQNKIVHKSCNLDSPKKIVYYLSHYLFLCVFPYSENLRSSTYSEDLKNKKYLTVFLTPALPASGVSLFFQFFYTDNFQQVAHICFYGVDL